METMLKLCIIQSGQYNNKDMKTIYNWKFSVWGGVTNTNGVQSNSLHILAVF